MPYKAYTHACGYVPTVPLETLAEMRAKVLSRFPDSGHGPVPVLGPFARNLATGKVISVADRPNRTRRGRRMPRPETPIPVLAYFLLK